MQREQLTIADHVCPLWYVLHDKLQQRESILLNVKQAISVCAAWLADLAAGRVHGHGQPMGGAPLMANSDR